MKRIMIDMSVTLIHHGHIRLIKKAKQYGKVIIGLTTDEEILSCKGYEPELSYDNRKEILDSISDVDEVVPTPWSITEETLDDYNIDLLVHGHDNSNFLPKEKLLIFPRTGGVSSTQLRERALRSITQINNRKLMLTPGPAMVLHENLQYIKPIFGRGDDEYTKMSKEVLSWVKKQSGQDEVIMAQGSATFALELAAHSFIRGNVLIISTGYYSDRLERLLPDECTVSICTYDKFHEITDEYDWVLCAYTETSQAFKVDLKLIREKTDKLSALLYIDATGSIGLEKDHELADVMAFSSCKGLFGLTGACFIAYKNNLETFHTKNFYFNLNTHKEKMVTGPYHTIASLYGVMKVHDKLKQRVKNSKTSVMKKWSNLVRSDENQPLLCTYIEGNVSPNDDQVVLYSPRSKLAGSVVCHFGEIHSDKIDIQNRIKIC